MQGGCWNDSNVRFVHIMDVTNRCMEIYCSRKKEWTLCRRKVVYTIECKTNGKVLDRYVANGRKRDRRNIYRRTCGWTVNKSIKSALKHSESCDARCPPQEPTLPHHFRAIVSLSTANDTLLLIALFRLQICFWISFIRAHLAVFLGTERDTWLISTQNSRPYMCT